MAAISVLFMLFMGIVFLFPTTPQTDVPDMNYTVVVLFGVMILSLVYYYFPKYGGVYWFTGPIATIDTAATLGRGSRDSEELDGKKGLEKVETTEVS